VLGTYAIDLNGDTTSTLYGLYRVGTHGEPTFVNALRPKLR
jgi:hypothetical protein